MHLSWQELRTVTLLRLFDRLDAWRRPQRLQQLLDCCRADFHGRLGFADTHGYHRVPGVEAVAAPVFNFKNEITMAVLVVGVQGMFDTSPEGEVVRCLKRHAEALSLRLGATGEPKVPV